MNTANKRTQNAIKKKEAKKEMVENIMTLKRKGYSDHMIAKILKVPLSSVRVEK